MEVDGEITGDHVGEDICPRSLYLINTDLARADLPEASMICAGVGFFLCQ